MTLPLVILYRAVVKDPTLEFKGMPPMPLMTSLCSASTLATEVFSMQNYDVTDKPGPTVTGSATKHNKVLL